MLAELARVIRRCRTNALASMAAAASIAIGIGACAAVFTVAETVIARALPYEAPDRLVLVSAELRARETRDLPLSGPDFLDLQRETRAVFEETAALLTMRAVLTGADGSPQLVRVALASPAIFRVLGLSVQLGRDFDQADGQPLADADLASGPAIQRTSTVAILSHEYWQRRHGGDPSVLGRRVSTAAGLGAQIVGVLEPGAELAFPPASGVERRPDVWISVRIPYDVAQRASFSYRVAGRLRAGVSLEHARVGIDAVTSRLRDAFPLWQSADFHLNVERLDRYVTAAASPVVTLLLGAASCLLLIGCANAVNLSMVDASYRWREAAIRHALGAGRGHVVRQAVMQAAVLSGIGTAAGAMVSWLALRIVVAMAPADFPRIDAVRVGATTLWSALLLGCAVTAIVGLVPVAWSAGRDRAAALRVEGGRMPSLHSGPVMRAVVVGEVTLSFVLLLASGLMLRSLVAIQRVDPGFEPRGLLTFQVIGDRPATPDERRASMDETARRLAEIPGVRAVTAAFPLPLADPFNPIRWGLEEALSDESRFRAADYQIVRPGYFDTLGTPLVAGRDFAADDNAPDRAVVVIDESLARRAFGRAADAVGRRLLVRIRTPEPEWVEVIGVTANQRGGSLDEPGRERVYFADGFLGHAAAGRWAIRVDGDPAQYAGAAQAAVARGGRALVATELDTMATLVDRAQARTRFTFVLLIVLAGLAVTLAVVGIYSLLSTIVHQRTSEVGTRMAFGARPRHVLALILSEGLGLTAVGLALGLAGSTLATRLMTGLLVAVEPTDGVTYGMAMSIYVIVAGAACLVPARRAMRLDPLAAMRGE